MLSFSPWDRWGLRISSLGLILLSPPGDCLGVKESSLQVKKFNLSILCSRSLWFPSGGCPAGAVAHHGRRGRL